jgi:hypothetical protein
MSISRLLGALLVSTGLPVFGFAEGGGQTIPVPAGKVTLVTSPLPVLPAPKDGSIAGYGFSGRVSGYECASSVPTAAGAIDPPPGDDVCVFALSLTMPLVDGTTPGGQDIPQLAGMISFGSTKIAISYDTITWYPTDDFAVAVPAGTRPTLTLSAAGFGQSFSFATGSPVGVRPAVLYRPSSERLSITTGEKAALSETDLVNGATATDQVTISSVELSYFSPADELVHALPPDEAYLGIDFNENNVAGPQGYTFEGSPPLSPSAVRLVTPTATLQGTPIDESPIGLLSTTYVFTVPANVTTAELQLGPAVESMELYDSSGIPSGPDNIRIGEATIGSSAASASGSTPASPGASGGSVAVPISAGAGGGLVVIVLPIILWRRRQAARRLVINVSAPRRRYVEARALVRPAPALAAGDPTSILVAPGPRPGPEEQEERRPEPADDGPLEVLVIGPLLVRHWAEAPKRPFIIDLVVYLAFCGEIAVGPDKLRMVLGDIEGNTLRARVSELRRAIGKDRLPRAGRYGYRLAEGAFYCDWIEFNRLRDEAAALDDEARIERLWEAMRLVRGEPFAGATSDRFEWLGGDFVISNMARTIEETAHELAVLLREAGRERESEDACLAGLRGDPNSSLLHCDRMRAVAAEPARVLRVLREAIVVVGPLPDLIALSEELTGRKFDLGEE